MSEFDDEYPEDGYDDDDGESLTFPCSNCGADVYEDAPQCPVCGEYVTRSSSATAGMPTWMLVLGVLGVLSVIGSLLLLG